MNHNTFENNDQSVLFELHKIMDDNIFRVFCNVHCQLKEEDINFCSKIRSCGRVAEAVERSSRVWTIEKLRDFLDAAKTAKHYGIAVAEGNAPCEIKFPTTT